MQTNRTKSTLFLIISLLIFMGATFAQTKTVPATPTPTPTLGLTLAEALNRAVKNRLELKIQTGNVQIANNEISKVNARNLPQISSDWDLRQNTQLQSNVLPSSFFGPSAKGDKVVQFGTGYNTMIGFNLTQNLFNPTNRGDKAIAQLQVKYNELNVKKTEEDIKLDVMQSYFTVLLWNEKLALGQANEKRTAAIYQTATQQLSQGTITDYEAKRCKIDLDNATAEYKKSSNSLQLALIDLYYRMGEDSVSNVPLADDIQKLYNQFAAADTKASDTKATDPKRPALDMEKTQSIIWQLNTRKQNLNYFPTISFYANYTFQDISNDNPFNANSWYPFNYLGIKASIPIFDGMQKERNKQEYKLRLEVSKFNYDKLMKDYKQDMNNTWTNMQNARADLDFQEKNLALINELYKIDTDHLANGTIKPNDLTTTYYTLQQTQTNYLTAVYNYLIAVANYKKANGSL